MKYIKKVDQWLFALVSKIVVGWVKRKKMQKHKIDFFIMLHNWEMAYWLFVIALIIVLGVYHHRQITAFITASVTFTVVAVGGVVTRWSLNNDKKSYDEIFAMRKIPQMYNFVKSLTETLYEEHWPTRKFFLGLDIIALVYFCTSPSIVAPLFFLLTFRLYQTYIFDFDEPEKKEKKEKQSLTEVAQNAWRQLVGGFAPGGV